MKIKTLCDTIRQTAYDIHVYHGNGHFEKVYENALVHRLRKQGFDVEQQFSIEVYDEDGTEIGDYVADLLVEGERIIELKATKSIAAEHVAQILGYLASSRKQHGLLINFGSYRFQIKKYAGRAGGRAGGFPGSGPISTMLFALYIAFDLILR